MRLGVVSDTHGHLAFAEQAARVLRAERVEVVLHCGDIGSADIPSAFMEWPAHYVFGNVDDDEAFLRGGILDAGGTCHGRFVELELVGRRIALLHSDDGVRFRETVRGGRYDLVCYGHTHQARVERVGKTTVLNPGALYRANPHQIAVVDLPELLVRHIVVDVGEGESP
jgi:putative phosphoesterase